MCVWLLLCDTAIWPSGPTAMSDGDEGTTSPYSPKPGVRVPSALNTWMRLSYWRPLPLTYVLSL